MLIYDGNLGYLKIGGKYVFKQNDIIYIGEYLGNGRLKVYLNGLLEVSHKIVDKERVRKVQAIPFEDFKVKKGKLTEYLVSNIDLSEDKDIKVRKEYVKVDNDKVVKELSVLFEEVPYLEIKGKLAFESKLQEKFSKDKEKDLKIELWLVKLKYALKDDNSENKSLHNLLSEIGYSEEEIKELITKL